nr:hypothetical protein GCM10017745_46870 [Saccharothrix mutabilis subsp. capreolus]
MSRRGTGRGRGDPDTDDGSIRDRGTAEAAPRITANPPHSDARPTTP